MKKFIIKSIEFYQKTWSRDHSWRKIKYPYGGCIRYPSCSEYCRLSVLQFGSIKGLYFGFLRVITCHPWQKPGVDWGKLDHRSNSKSEGSNSTL